MKKDRAKYESIFEHSAVPLWEEDISRLRAKLREMKTIDGFDLRAHLAAHPGFVPEAVGLIEATDVNQATLRLFEADRKEQLLGPLSPDLGPSSRAAFVQTILAIDEGITDIEAESSVRTLRGKKLALIVKTHIPPADADYPSMLVSLVDITAQKQAQEFAENLIHTANVMVVGLDLEGRVTIFNTAAEETSGYSRAEIIHRSWFETIVPKERYPEAWAEFGKYALGGGARTFENPILTRSGEERFVVWQNSPIREGGRATGTLSFGIDITDRRRMEQDLARERTLFNMLMDNLPDYIYFKDSASRFIRTSRSHARALGLGDFREVVGKTDADFYGADHARKAFEDEQRVMITGSPLVDIEERETYPNRPDTWANTSKMPFRDLAGTIVGTFGISHDITERKRLQEKNQQLAILVESVDDAIVALDLERRITVWNRGAERIYGYSAGEMIGTPTSRMIPPDLEDEARMMREHVLRGEQITNYETTRLHKNGSRIAVSLTLAAIRDPGGRIVGMASVARDITAAKELQAQVNRAQRLEGLATLAGGVAHQFNNIATVVGGYLTVLQSDARLPASLTSYVAAALTGVRKAVDITDRLLVLTEPGGVSSGFRLDVLARILLPLHEKRIEEEKVHLVLDLVETPPVQGDEVRMRFVLSGLIGNALDSLLDRPERTVSLRTGSTDTSAWFEVEDSGCGIPAEDLPRVFTPFFSAKGEWAAPGSPQARLKGVGLSLAISNSTVSGYSGRIEVRSTRGAGSTFRVVMPLAGR